MALITPLGTHNLIPGLVAELPLYLTAAATCTGFNHADVKEFTADMLVWWKFNQSKIPNWAHAARIAFSILPSSAPCERVFSLVESMFGTEQLHVLGDQLQGSVMLRSNQRAVG